MRILGRRIDWQPWRWSTRTWVIALVVSFVLAPPMTRWFCLWQIPDVRLPFDVDEFRSWRVPDNQNAFHGYVQFQQLLGKTEFESFDQKPAPFQKKDQPLLDDRALDRWLVANQELLLMFERTSQMPLSLAEPLDQISNNSHVPLLEEFPKQIKLVQAEAARCERLGDFQRSWEWHLACLRCGRHIEMNGYTVAAGQGRRIRFLTYPGIVRWASYADVSIAQLQQARRDLVKDLKSARLHSEILKFEYVMNQNTMARDDWADQFFQDGSQFWRSIPNADRLQRFFLWTTGEPEVSMRLLRQVVVNQLQQIDTPARQRQSPVRTEYPKVFKLNPTDRLLPGQLSSERLARLLEGPIGQRLLRMQLFSDVGTTSTRQVDLDHQMSSDQNHVDVVDVVLACQEFQRDHGQFPQKLEELVPKYLDQVPVDELNPLRAPVCYRRQQANDAIVWSVGHDGIDQGGNIGTVENQGEDRGYRLKIFAQGTSQNVEVKNGR